MGTTAFADFLGQAIKAAELNQSTFAARVGHPRAFINQILKGTRSPPLDRLNIWAKSLNLREEGEVKRFIDLAAIAHIPVEVRPRFETWYEEHQQLKADYADLFAEVRALKRVADK